MKTTFKDLSQQKTLNKALNAGVCELSRKNTARQVVDSAIMITTTHMSEDEINRLHGLIREYGE